MRLRLPLLNWFAATLLVSIVLPVVPFVAETAMAQEQRDRENTNLLDRGRQLFYRGELQPALEILQRALANYQETGDRSGEAATQISLGEVYLQIGLRDEALAAAQAALPLYQADGNRQGMGYAYTIMGAVYSGREEYDKATEALQQALTIAQETNNRFGEAIALASLAQVNLSQSQLESGLQQVQQALNQLNENPIDPLGLLQAPYYRGGLLTILALAQIRQPEAAIATLDQAMAIAAEIDSRSIEGQVLLVKAALLQTQGDLEAALATYQQALAIAQSTGSRSSEGTILTFIAGIYNQQENYKQALNAAQQALEVYQDLKLPISTFEFELLHVILFRVIEVYARADRSSESIPIYQQVLAALQLSEGITFLRLEVTALQSLGLAYDNQGQTEQALETNQLLLPKLQELIQLDPGVETYRFIEATTLLTIARLQEQRGRYAEALDGYEQALAIARDINRRDIEVFMLFSIGVVHRKTGEFAQAHAALQQARALAIELRDADGEFNALARIAEVYSAQGDRPQAIAVLQQALQIAEANQNFQSQNTALNNIAFNYWSIGQYGQAVDFFQQALAANRQRTDDAVAIQLSEARLLDNLGLVYERMGQYNQALEYHQQALAIVRNSQNTFLGGLAREQEGRILNNIGVTYYRQQQFEQALDYLQQALAIAEALTLPSERISPLNNIAVLFEDQGRYDEALEYHQQALTIARSLNDRGREAATLNNIGRVYYNQKNYDRALEFYQQSLAIAQAIGDQNQERTTLFNIGDLLVAQEQTELAIVFLKRSVNVSEVMRSDLRNLSTELQQSYVETVDETYRRLADLLLQQDRVLEAQRVLDLLKVQELEDYLQDVRGTAQTINGVAVLQPEAEILERYQALQNSAIELGQELAQLRQIPESDRTASQQQRIAQLVQLQEDLNEQFNQFAESPEILALLDQLSPQAVRATPDLAGLDSLRDQLRSINAVMIYPLVLDDRLEIVITTPNSPPLRRTVNVRREELNSAILQFRQALQDPRRDAKAPAQQLYSWLIAPIEADLDRANVDPNQTQTLLYAPDGQLRYVPLAALYDGQQWLAQRYRVNNITAESLTELTTQPRREPRILAGAFADVGIEYSVPMGDRSAEFRGLPFAGREVENLSALVTDTTKLVDRAFTLEAIAPRLNEYNIVHFATHAAFVPGAPEASFILFGNGDRPTLRDIGSWTLNDVDLVVLSACETGVGGFGNGEEVLGLGYQFQRRGARAVIASLWQVNDGGTQILMDAFYLALSNGYSKTEALQRAQQALITGDLTAVGAPRGATVTAISTRTGLPASVNNNLSHPYYWAPFILIGNGL